MGAFAVSLLLFLLQVQESFVPLGGVSGELGLAIGGGADYGEFPFVTAAHGGGATVGDIILEIGGTPVLGMTLGDVRGVLNSCPHPIRIKTVSPGIPAQKYSRVWTSGIKTKPFKHNHDMMRKLRNFNAAFLHFPGVSWAAKGQPSDCFNGVVPCVSWCCPQARPSVRTSGYTSASVSRRAPWTASCSS